MPGQPLTALQWITWACLVLAFVATLVYEKCRASTISGVPFVLVALHGMVYYTLLHLTHVLPGWLPPWYEIVNFQTWSAILRMHSGLTIAMVFIFEAREQCRFKKYLDEKRT